MREDRRRGAVSWKIIETRGGGNRGFNQALQETEYERKQEERSCFVENERKQEKRKQGIQSGAARNRK